MAKVLLFAMDHKMFPFNDALVFINGYIGSVTGIDLRSIACRTGSYTTRQWKNFYLTKNPIHFICMAPVI